MWRTEEMSLHFLQSESLLTPRNSTSNQKEITCRRVLYLAQDVCVLEAWDFCIAHCGNAEEKDHYTCISFVLFYVRT